MSVYINFIKNIIEHRVDEDDDTFELKVRWLGWGAEADTWEPIHQLVEDAPHHVEEYLRGHDASEACNRYLKEYFPG